MNDNFTDQTITGLRLARGDLRRVAREAQVDYSWLSKFVRHVYADPSSRRVERVYRALVARGLVAPVVDFAMTYPEAEPAPADQPPLTRA